MLLSSEGIVLSSTKYGESSQISKVFSNENGLISLISSRPKSKKNKLANYFQPLSIIQFVCYVSNKSNIWRVKEVAFSTNHNFYNNDIADNSLRYFLAELLSKVIKEEETNKTLYAFIETQICLLKEIETNKSSFHIRFLLKLLLHLGMQPQLKSDHTYFDYEEGQSSMQKPLHDNYCENNRIKLIIRATKDESLRSKTERSMILNTLLSYYSIQLDVDLINLKSKQVFEELFC